MQKNKNYTIFAVVEICIHIGSRQPRTTYTIAIGDFRGKYDFVFFLVYHIANVSTRNKKSKDITMRDLEIIEGKTIAELREIAKLMGISPSNMKKQELIERIAAASTEQPAEEQSDVKKEEVAETDAPKTDGAPKAEIAISVGKLLPAMAAEGSMLQDMEVRLVSAQDGTCKVEITTADSKTAELTVSKNTENGRWEVTGTEEE